MAKIIILQFVIWFLSRNTPDISNTMVVTVMNKKLLAGPKHTEERGYKIGNQANI
jgi:hypothetical protein